MVPRSNGDVRICEAMTEPFVIKDHRGECKYLAYRDKISLCPFHPNYIALCPPSQTNLGNAPLLKLDFFKIELSPIVTFLRTYSDIFKDL